MPWAVVFAADLRILPRKRYQRIGRDWPISPALRFAACEFRFFHVRLCAGMVKLRMLYVGQEAVIYAIGSERYKFPFYQGPSCHFPHLTAGVCCHESTKVMRMLSFFDRHP